MAFDWLIRGGTVLLATYHPLTTDYGAIWPAQRPSTGSGPTPTGVTCSPASCTGRGTALMVGFGASVLGATLGAIIGVAGAYFGGRVDLLVQRVMDLSSRCRSSSSPWPCS